jgi:DNA repair exonuclease SbcCD ATPase subunit
MDNIKLPIALVLAMAAQLAAGVWWVSQQASTIANLEETVSQLGSRMAIEDNVNLKRDVLDNSMELDYTWNELEEIWDELASMAMTINEINKIKQRVAIIENDIKYIGKDHLDMKGGMK